MSSEHSTRTGRHGQDGPPSQGRLQLPPIRRNSANERSLRRRKIFWLSILCWLMVLCLTAIIIIAVVHFQGSNNEIDQISAGALIGFGVLLIFVLAWAIIIYAKFSRLKAKRRSAQYRPSREEFVAFASSEILGRGISTISTTNSSSNSRSTERSAEGEMRRFVYRQRSNDEERRVIDRTTQAPTTSIPSSSRMTPQYHERGPDLSRPQMTHLPERHRAETEPQRVFVDTSSRAARRHSAPLPPPYQPPISPPYRTSESLPTDFMGTPPPAYDRVCGRSRRCESTTSEDSCLNPPAYQSRPPSPSPGSSAAVPVEGGRHLTVPSHRSGMGVVNPVSALPLPGRVRRYEVTPSHPQQSSHLPASGVVLRENVIYHNQPRTRPSSASLSGAQTQVITATRYTPPYYRSTSTPHYHASSHLPSSTSHSAFVLPRYTPESYTRPVSPPYITNRPPSSRPALAALAAPETSTRLSHVPNRPPSPIQETSEVEIQEENACNTNETTTSSTTTTPASDTHRPSVVLVYLSQSPDEEIIV
ncbi:hypothetical protein ACROYT_G012226 [Oculina patagonica]